MGILEELEEAFSRLRDPGHMRYCPLCQEELNWVVDPDVIPIKHSWFRANPQTENYFQHWVYCDNALCSVLSLFSVTDQKEEVPG